MTIKRPVLCSCCGTECNYPQWFKGKPYGYTCITKVAPSQKRSKDTGLWVKADSIEIKDKSKPTTTATVKVEGRSFSLSVRIDHNGEIVSARGYADGYLQIAKHRNGTGSLYKNLFIEQDRDEKGKLYPVKAYISYRDKDVVIAEF